MTGQRDSSSDQDVARLRRLRWAVRCVLMLGVAASVAANVLHASSNPIARAIASWPPLALLLTIELISRVPALSKTLRLVRIAAASSIAGIAAWVSYWHMAGVAARYGETGLAPYLVPLSVDGLIVVSSVCLVELSGRIRAVQGESFVVVAASAEAPIVDVDEAPETPTAAVPEVEPEREPDEGNDAESAAGLTDAEYQRVLKAVRAYRRSNSGRRPSRAYVRERAKLAYARTTREVIDRAIAELDAQDAPKPEPEPKPQPSLGPAVRWDGQPLQRGEIEAVAAGFGSIADRINGVDVALELTTN